MNVLELRNLRAGYGSIDVLHGLDLVVSAGQVHALLGPNGAGKTTTLSVCSGQIRPSAGQTLLCGRDVTGTSSDALARGGVCLVPEGRGVFPNLTVTENLRMFTHAGTRFADVQERAFGQFPRLAERRDQLAGTMSGGEQQMLALSWALATNPALLLLDELSMGLAPLVVKELYAHVADLADTGMSILIVEQFAQTVLGVCDIASIMLHGGIASTGPPHEIADDLAQAYLEPPNDHFEGNAMSNTDENLSPRLQEFVRDVDDLKVTGGRANPERTWMILGAIALIAGVVVTLVAWIRTGGTSNTGDFADFAAMGRFGMALTFAGAALFAVMSIRRWFRFWLVRLVYEMREQSDRFDSGLVAAVDRDITQHPSDDPSSSPQ